jgi:hypothetical protein
MRCMKVTQLVTQLATQHAHNSTSKEMLDMKIIRLLFWSVEGFDNLISWPFLDHLRIGNVGVYTRPS